jgi:hypothetical protein
MTVKFKDAAAAQACILKNNGRFFDGRKVCTQFLLFSSSCGGELMIDSRRTVHG